MLAEGREAASWTRLSGPGGWAPELLPDARRPPAPRSLRSPQKGGVWERGDSFRQAVGYLCRPGKVSFPRGVVVVWL